MTGWVYRAYDATGRLIYVGSTSDLFARLASHQAQSWWAFQVVKVKATVHGNLVEARAVERRAIAEENPRWNIMGRWARRATWTADDYADFHQALAMTGNSRTAHNAQRLARIRRECQIRFGVSILPERIAS